MAGIQVVVRNRRAFHEYTVEERYEAGLVLLGSEVKSLRDGRAQLQDAYVDLEEGELFLVGAHISPYGYSSYQNHDPLRPRKLLMHAREIAKIQKKVEIKGYTAIALSIYLKDGRFKVEIAMAIGKKNYDKRQDLRKAEENRDMRRAFKESYR